MDARPDPVDELARDAAVGDFVELWHADQAAGTARTLVEYLARFPGFEPAIAREYLGLTEPATSGSDPVAPAEFGPYRTLCLLGQGGQGQVWLAEDVRLGRHVALKVLTGTSAPVMAGRVERLRREAQALARLAHPGICAIHEAQFDGPRPWLAMQWIPGETLAVWLARRSADSGPRAIQRSELAAWLAFFVQAAQALQAAHELGILHRDVKPANLMRTPAGAPVLLDFGLAHDLEADLAHLTQSGELFGTLPYMAPEVLAARPVDQRADVYALAVTMYEVLAGRRPFVGATQAALRQAIADAAPPALPLLAPAVGRDLAVVVATAMEAELDRRYATAAAFAEDLRRVQSGETIHATPRSGWARLRRLVHRHPAWASSFVLLALGLLVATVLVAQLARERTRLLALRQAHLARQLVAEQPGLALLAASEAARAAQHPEIHDVLYLALDRCWEEHALVETPELMGSEPTAVEITADDRYLVRAVRDRLQIVDLAAGRVARTFGNRGGAAARVALLADDAVLVGGADGSVRLLDLANGDERRAWPLHRAVATDGVAVASLVVAPDRRRFASCGSDGRVVVVDTAVDSTRNERGEGVVSCVGHVGGASMAAFAPDGRRLATLGGRIGKVPPGDRCVRVFAADTGTPLHVFGPFPGHPLWLAWSHDGRQLAIARSERGVDVHDLAAGTVRQVACARPVQWVAFGPDDATLVFGSEAGLTVHDLERNHVLVHHADFQDRSVFRGAFAPDGKRLAVIAWDDTARLYGTDDWQPQQVFHGVVTRPLGLAWNRRGDRLYTSGGCLQSWYTAERPFLPVARGLPGRLVSAHFSTRGDRIVAANVDGEVRIWEAAHCRPVANVHADGPLVDVRFCGDDDHLLLVGDGVPARLLDAAGDAVAIDAVVATAGFALGRQHVVLTAADGSVRVHDVATGAERQRVTCHDGAIVAAALHPSRPWLATGGSDRSFHLVDLERGTTLFASSPWRPGDLGANERVLACAFAPAGDRLFVSCEDLAVREVDLDGGFEVRELRLKPTPGTLLVGTDGNTLLVGARWSGKLYRCDARTLELLGPHPARHANLLVALQQRPGGREALSASRDGVVAVFDVDRDELISVIHATTGTLVTACFNPAGDTILTADATGEVRLWPLDPLAVALRHRPGRAAAELRGR